MNKKEYQTLKRIFIFDENNILHPYKDSLGNWTIGIGHLIGDNIQNLKITDKIASLLFRRDLSDAIETATTIFGQEFFNSLEIGRKAAILILCFTLGKVKLLKFTETVPAIKAKEWDKAAELIKNTKWALDVDPRQRLGKGRDDRVSYMLRTGLIDKEYQIKE